MPEYHVGLLLLKMSRRAHMRTSKYMYMSRNVSKVTFGVSDQVQNKLVCTVTEEIFKLEILDIRRRGISVE